MNAAEIIKKVKSLDFEPGTYIVFGSCPMALAGLREANDIDLLVNDDVFKELRKHGWKEIVKSRNDKPLVNGEFEAHRRWDFSSYKPTLAQLIYTGSVVDGVAFASLMEVRKWKQASGRPKDIADLKLIDNALGMVTY